MKKILYSFLFLMALLSSGEAMAGMEVRYYEGIKDVYDYDWYPVTGQTSVGLEIDFSSRSKEEREENAGYMAFALDFFESKGDGVYESGVGYPHKAFLEVSEVAFGGRSFGVSDSGLFKLYVGGGMSLVLIDYRGYDVEDDLVFSSYDATVGAWFQLGALATFGPLTTGIELRFSVADFVVDKVDDDIITADAGGLMLGATVGLSF